MKRIALVAAVLFTAACGAKEETTPIVDSAAPAVAPAPAPAVDSMVMDSTMRHDSATDTTKS